MDKHLDAIGYLLAALVFSVGFLSNRIHARLDSTVRAVSERSGRARQAISEGSRLGPSDLAELLSIAHSATDYVSFGSRVLNWGILAAICVVFGDAVGLRSAGARAPDHEMVVIAMLFATSLGVVLFSEFDVRRVTIEQRRELAASTLGRIQKLASLMSRNKIPPAATALSDLKQTFASWGLLVELESYLDLLRGDAAAGLTKIEALVDSGGDLYLSPVVGTACCLQLASGDLAMALIARMQERGEPLRHLPQLRRALEISSVHLPELLARPEQGGADVTPAQETSASIAQKLIGQEFETRREPIRDLALDINPASVEQTAHLLAILDWWDSVGADSPPSQGLLPKLLEHVAGKEGGPPGTYDAMSGYIHSSRDPATLESLGLVSLARGEDRPALRFFESAIRMQPAAARSHWGRAIACHRLGWLDAATTSLKRATTLSSDTPLISHSRRLFKAGSVQLTPREISSSYPTGLDDMERFQLALLGITTPGDQDDSVRGKFAGALISLALGAPPAQSVTR